MKGLVAAAEIDFSKIEKRAPSVARMFQDRVAATPHAEAFRYPHDDGWESVTWHQVGERVRHIAAGLISLGIAAEDRVALASSTRYEWVLVDFAVMCAGAATTTVYPTTIAGDVAYIVTNSGSRVVVAEDQTQVDKLLRAPLRTAQGAQRRDHRRQGRRQLGDHPARTGAAGLLHPAPHNGIDPPCEFGEGLPGSAVQAPGPHLLPDLLQGVLADRGRERDEHAPVLGPRYTIRGLSGCSCSPTSAILSCSAASTWRAWRSLTQCTTASST